MSAVTPIPVRPAKPKSLMQVEVPLFFHALLQSGSIRKPSAESCAVAAHGWITLEVFGEIAPSELSGAPTIENMRLMCGDVDLEPILPDNIVNAIASYVANN